MKQTTGLLCLGVIFLAIYSDFYRLKFWVRPYWCTNVGIKFKVLKQEEILLLHCTVQCKFT